MNKTEDPTGNAFDQFTNRLYDTLGDRVKALNENPSPVVFWMIGIAILFVLIIPDLVVGIGWAVDLLGGKKFDIPSMLFEVMVIGLVFAFGLGLLFYLKSREPSLVYMLLMISYVLTILATSMFGVVTNKCLPDLECDSFKYIYSMALVTGLALASYVLLRVLNMNRASPLFVITYLAICIWEAMILIWQAGRSVGIKPSLDALQGVILFIYSIIWLVIFATNTMKVVMPAKPDRWGT